MKYFFLFIALLLNIPALCQTTKYKFTVFYEDRNPLKYDVILINRQEVSTDGNGNVEVDIQNSESTVTIASPNSNRYRIKYPPNSVVILPRSTAVAVEIIVDKPSSNSPTSATKEDITKLHKIIESYKKSKDAALVKSIQDYNNRLYDSIAVLLKTSYKTKSKLEEGRLEFFPQISKALNHYLNEAKDLNDAFSVLTISLNKKDADEQFAAAIYSYNEIYELINQNKSTYEQAISTYWNSKELGFKFSNLLEYTLEEIHKPYILEMNDAFIERLYNYKKENSKRKKRELEKNLVADMTKHSEALSKRLNSLGERIAAFTAILTNIEGS